MANPPGFDDELRSEYDESVFENAERGKYAGRYAAGTKVVRPGPDVAETFPGTHTRQGVGHA